MFYVMRRTFRPQRLGEVSKKTKNAIGNRLHRDGDLIGHYIQNTGYAHSFACYPTLEAPLFICISSAPLGASYYNHHSHCSHAHLLQVATFSFTAVFLFSLRICPVSHPLLTNGAWS